MTVKDWCRIEAKAQDEGSPSTADIYIYDEIGYWGTEAQAFAQQIAGLDAEQINLYVNSPGGDAWDGIAIMNALRRHPAKVHVTVDGIAASAASLICMAGDHITMNASTELMIHDASGMAWGNAQTMEDTAGLLNKLSDSYADAYAKRAGGTREEWRATMKAETWFTAEEAVLAGLADKWDGATPAAASAFDMSRFQYRGRAQAPAPKPTAHQSMMRALFPKDLPATEPGQPNRKDDTMSILSDGLRERLGITDAEADEAAILAAFDTQMETLTAPKAEAPKAALPDGVVAIEATVLDELKASAALANELKAKADADRRAGIVATAIDEGRIAPARRDHWVAQLNADEEGAVAVLASLAVGTIPTGEVGHQGDVEASPDDALYNKITGGTK